MADRYAGILFIGDPHLASRSPGFRKDDYPHVILSKLQWCMNLAREDRLLPVLLGDLFHWPRDNANWLLTELMRLLADAEVLGVTGNHDTTERVLREDDSLSILAAAGRLRLVDQAGAWRGVVGGTPVGIGGSTWSDPLPTDLPTRPPGGIGIWIAHHNIAFGGIGSNWTEPYEIPGIDIVVNGHIHKRFADVVVGQTTWMNPGNIARVKRSDVPASASPSVLRIDFDNGGWRSSCIAVPHVPFEEVFFESLALDAPSLDGSDFVKGLEALRNLKTPGGAGLMEFLEENMNQFEPDVAGEIRSLAQEVLKSGA